MYSYPTKKQCPSWPTGREVMTTSSCWVRGYNSTPSPTVQSTPVNRTVERDSAVSLYGTLILLSFDYESGETSDLKIDFKSTVEIR